MVSQQTPAPTWRHGGREFLSGCVLPAAEACPGSLPPPLDWAPPHYLFKCSSRKRKVMRLGSGRERSRCIMQFSLAAGSDRAVGREGAGAGLGSGQGGLSLLWSGGYRTLRESPGCRESGEQTLQGRAWYFPNSRLLEVPTGGPTTTCNSARRQAGGSADTVLRLPAESFGAGGIPHTWTVRLSLRQ